VTECKELARRYSQIRFSKAGQGTFGGGLGINTTRSSIAPVGVTIIVRDLRPLSSLS
jgi:hypothetical protein